MKQHISHIKLTYRNPSSSDGSVATYTDYNADYNQFMILDSESKFPLGRWVSTKCVLEENN